MKIVQEVEAGSFSNLLRQRAARTPSQRKSKLLTKEKRKKGSVIENVGALQIEHRPRAPTSTRTTQESLYRLVNGNRGISTAMTWLKARSEKKGKGERNRQGNNPCCCGRCLFSRNPYPRPAGNLTNTTGEDLGPSLLGGKGKEKK